MQFADRRHAGRWLAKELERYRGDRSVIVLALPRGGVPVAFEVAQALNADLDVFIVRKLGFPGHEEFAMGAIATGGVRVMNPDLAGIHVDEKAVEQVVARERAELARREVLYRDERAPALVEGRNVILVDDGLATGSTMLAAAAAVKRQQPRSVVVAVPVAAPEACQALRREVDEVVCAATPTPFRAVGLWYEDFRQVTDAEVREQLHAAWKAEAARRDSDAG